MEEKEFEIFTGLTEKELYWMFPGIFKSPYILKQSFIDDLKSKLNANEELFNNKMDSSANTRKTTN